MNNFLPSIINTLSSGSQESINSLITEIKSSKQDVSSLISRLSSFRLNSNFSPVNFNAFDQINRQVLVDIFRDVDLRLRTYYSSVNVVSLFINSIIDVYSSEIKKIEKDINNLEYFINNYEFISGKDDLFNSNYLEKFDNFTNDYRADGYTFALTDRDGDNFDESGNGFIDTKLGLFKIGKKVYRKNSIDFVQSYSIKSNYDNYITSNSDFDSLLNESPQDSWSVTLKSPFVITSKISEYFKYIKYPTTNIFGAQTAVEINFSSGQTIDSIVIDGGHGEGLQLLQVVLFSSVDEKKFTTNNYSEESELEDFPTIIPDIGYGTSGEFGILSAPRLIEGLSEITFAKKSVNKVVLLFNQPTYVRTENLPLFTELNSRDLYNTSSFIKKIKNINTDKLQNLAYNFFLKNNSYKQTSKNAYSKVNDYYSYKYPIINNNLFSINYEKNYISENFSFNLTDALPNNLITNLFKNMLSNSLNDKGEIFEKSTFINSDSNINSVFNFTKTNFLPIQNTNNIVLNSNIEPLYVKYWKQDTLKGLVSSQRPNLYEYSFSIRNISFCETESNEYSKSCFVSKKINFNGYPLAIKANLIKNNNEFNILDSKLDLKYPLSYEFSISNKDIISSEQDWIPLVESGVDKIYSEVLFFDQQSYTAKTRFPFKKDTFLLYCEGVLVNVKEYKILDNSAVSILNMKQSSTYVCSYDIDLNLYNVDYVDFFRLNLIDETIKSSSANGYSNETFNGTGALDSIQLKNLPYINTKNISSAIYSPLIGTIFQGSESGYAPIKIKMPDGSIAINLTNYTGTKDFPEFRDSNSLYFFVQNGKQISFNKKVEGEIVVFYDYLADTIRFRLIIRKNISSTTYTGAVDCVLLKAKTKNYDPYYDKLTKAISNN